MMKFLHFTLLLLTAICTGCIDKQYDDCPQNNNLSIRFVYKGDGVSDIFSSQIHKVDLFVFDKSGRFVQTQTIDQQQLSTYQGAYLDLPTGEYQILCCGNAFDRTVLPTLNTTHNLADANLYNVVPQNGTMDTSDSLYYAFSNTIEATRINVTNSSEQTQVIEFKSAHIKFKIYIAGFNDPDGMGGSLPPVVEATAITPQYDFRMKPFGQEVLFTQTSHKTLIGNLTMDMATFITPRFNNDNSIKINIKKSSNQELVYQVDLKQFLIDNTIDVTALQELTIPILIEFKGVAVTVALPKWMQTPVNPEM